MTLLQRILAGMLLCLFLTGCGGTTFRAKGRVIKDGYSYLTGPGEGLRIFFTPEGAKSAAQFDSFAAVYDPVDGSFVVTGKDGKGLPPGNYRVGIQLMKSKEDLLGGRLLGKRSPIVLEVASSWDEIVIDLDQAHFDEHMAAATKKKK
jgi:hypothetical protein